MDKRDVELQKAHAETQYWKERAQVAAVGGIAGAGFQEQAEIGRAMQPQAQEAESAYDKIQRFVREAKDQRLHQLLQLTEIEETLKQVPYSTLATVNRILELAGKAGL